LLLWAESNHGKGIKPRIKVPSMSCDSEQPLPNQVKNQSQMVQGFEADLIGSLLEISNPIHILAKIKGKTCLSGLRHSENVPLLAVTSQHQISAGRCGVVPTRDEGSAARSGGKLVPNSGI
jgi:hypothetical protein